jgi:nucleoside-diphosphate-sugar epimerase
MTVHVTGGRGKIARAFAEGLLAAGLWARESLAIFR